MKQLKNLLFVTLLALLAWNCQKEETSIPQEDTAQTEQSVHRTTFWELPPHIREQALHTDRTARGKVLSGKGGEPFGEVVEDRVDVLETPDGTTSYTLGMEKLADGAYMDNLVVTEAMDGTLDTHILRYRPSDGWLAERASGDVGWDAYSGEIFIFDGEGDPKAAGVFSNGRVTGQATGKGMADREDAMDCEVTNVSYGGLEQDGEFYVTDIIIDYECNLGGSGLDPGSGLDNGGSEFPQGGGEPHGGGGGSPQGGGGQVPTLIDDRLVWENLIIGPDHPIVNISEYLNCFELTQGAQLTIYIDQPITNDPAAWTTGSGKAGHTFISLSQNGIRRTWGLYPEGDASPFDIMDPYLFGNNQNNEFDVSISLTINKYALQNIIEDAANYSINYNLDSNNCTDYALQVAALAGLILPDPQSTWPGGGEGSNPGAFGQAVRNMALPLGVSRNNNGGTSPSNMGNCN